MTGGFEEFPGLLDVTLMPLWFQKAPISVNDELIVGFVVVFDDIGACKCD